LATILEEENFWKPGKTWNSNSRRPAQISFGERFHH
jgi:hypothetical protein